jgi:hypothetical protein
MCAKHFKAHVIYIFMIGYGPMYGFRIILRKNRDLFPQTILIGFCSELLF